MLAGEERLRLAGTALDGGGPPVRPKLPWRRLMCLPRTFSGLKCPVDNNNASALCDDKRFNEKAPSTEIPPPPRREHLSWRPIVLLAHPH